MARKTEEKRPSIEELATEALRWLVGQGWASTQELMDFLLNKGASGMEAFKAIRFLDRQGAITAKVHEEVQGYEPTPHRPRGAGTRQYGQWMPVTVKGVFLTPSLGGISDPGEETRKRHLRFDGKVFIPRANIVAMLRRAADLIELGETPKTALKRVRAEPVVLPVETVQVVRRPVRPDRVAVEPIVHEAVPAGVTFELALAFPATHFSKEQICELLTVAGTQVGLSPAGGANGAWGLFLVEGIEVSAEG